MFKKKRILMSFVTFVAAVAMVGCSVDTSVVEDGSPYDYPDKTWGEVLEDVCDDGEWESFVSEDDEDIVEFNGTIDETGAEICIQFEIDDDEFEISYMDVDGEVCDEYETAEIVALLFE